MRYNRGMIETPLPLAPDWRTLVPTPDPSLLLEQLATLRQENAALRAENAALRAENAVLHERVQELEARLGQTSANSSRPPSTDPPQAPARPKAPHDRAGWQRMVASGGPPYLGIGFGEAQARRSHECMFGARFQLPADVQLAAVANALSATASLMLDLATLDRPRSDQP